MMLVMSVGTMYGRSVCNAFDKFRPSRKNKAEMLKMTAQAARKVGMLVSLVWIFLCLSVSFVCVSVGLSLCQYVSLSVFASVSRCLCWSLSLLVVASVGQCQCRSVSLSVVSLSVGVSVGRCLSVGVSVGLGLCWSVFLLVGASVGRCICVQELRFCMLRCCCCQVESFLVVLG